jgi:hypothetical protein
MSAGCRWAMRRWIAKRAGIGHLRFHDLRHSAASLLIELGVPVTTVSEIVSHANSAITLSIYAHSVKGGRGPGRADDGQPAEGRRNLLVNPRRRPFAGSFPRLMWAKCGPIAPEGNREEPQTLME